MNYSIFFSFIFMSIILTTQSGQEDFIDSTYSETLKKIQERIDNDEYNKKYLQLCADQISIRKLCKSISKKELKNINKKDVKHFKNDIDFKNIKNEMFDKLITQKNKLALLELNIIKKETPAKKQPIAALQNIILNYQQPIHNSYISSEKPFEENNILIDLNNAADNLQKFLESKVTKDTN